MRFVVVLKYFNECITSRIINNNNGTITMISLINSFSLLSIRLLSHMQSNCSLRACPYCTMTTQKMHSSLSRSSWSSSRHFVKNWKATLNNLLISRSNFTTNFRPSQKLWRRTLSPKEEKYSSSSWIGSSDRNLLQREKTMTTMTPVRWHQVWHPVKFLWSVHFWSYFCFRHIRNPLPRRTYIRLCNVCSLHWRLSSYRGLQSVPPRRSNRGIAIIFIRRSR